MTLERRNHSLLQLLSKHTGITQGEIMDYFIQKEKKDMRNVLKDLKAIAEAERALAEKERMNAGKKLEEIIGGV